jgi:hypothetical protein
MLKIDISVLDVTVDGDNSTLIRLSDQIVVVGLYVLITLL